MDSESRPSLRRHWSLDPEVCFLNHGSFGACPTRVLEVQQELRAELERQPVDFFLRRFGDRLDAAREVLARFLNAQAEGLAFVQNATTGVNAVLGSLDFAPGDELLVTDHAYNACRNALVHFAQRAGVQVKVAALPFPLEDPEEIVAAILAEVGPRTRLALIDHVSSATAIVLPLERILAELEARAVDVLVDGAHAPGMLPLELDKLGAPYYTGNCHKWMCAPKGAAFLWVREDKRAATRPAVISHGANASTASRSRFRNEFDWIGTLDPSPWLCVPAAIECIGEMLPGGWPAVRRHNHELALAARRLLCDHLGQRVAAPDEMIGSIATVWMPDAETGPAEVFHEDALQRRLWDGWRIEVPIGCWPAPPKRYLRVSAQLYNTLADYERLVEALTSELEAV